MSSYEVMRRAIEFQGPDRLPINGWGDARLSDTAHVFWNQIVP